MKAIIYTTYGSPDVLQLSDVEKSTPKAKEVLVKIMATAVNPADNHALSGMLRYSTGLLKPKHQILGSDIAGVVEAVGEDNGRFLQLFFDDMDHLHHHKFVMFTQRTAVLHHVD